MTGALFRKTGEGWVKASGQLHVHVRPDRGICEPIASVTRAFAPIPAFPRVRGEGVAIKIGCGARWQRP